MTITAHPLADEILHRHASVLGDDAAAYRNHVLRCINYHTLLLSGPLPDHAVLAWAVHDLGIWTEQTFDYLQPSADLVDDLAVEFGITETERAKAMVIDHHRLCTVDDPETDTFRRADLVDVSHGLVRSGLLRSQVREVVAALPYRGFHRRLITGLGRYAAQHPLRPAPMLRW